MASLLVHLPFTGFTCFPHDNRQKPLGVPRVVCAPVTGGAALYSAGGGGAVASVTAVVTGLRGLFCAEINVDGKRVLAGLA